MPVGQYVGQVRAATHATAAATARCTVASAAGLDHKGDELHFNGVPVIMRSDSFCVGLEVDVLAQELYGLSQTKRS